MIERNNERITCDEKDKDTVLIATQKAKENQPGKSNKKENSETNKQTNEQTPDEVRIL